MTHDYLIAWRSSEFLVLLSWQIMTLILKVVFIRLRGHHLLTADCPMDGRHINELIWDRNSSLEYEQYKQAQKGFRPLNFMEFKFENWYWWFSVGICKYKPGYKSHDLCSHWLKLQHSDWRANFYKGYFFFK